MSVCLTQGGVGGDDAARAAGAVGVVRGAGQVGALTHRHLGHTLIPALDHLWMCVQLVTHW
jgi:hypothetical protein